MEVGIRKATAEDYTPLCRLFDEVDALHRESLPRLFQKPDGPAWDQDRYRETIADEDASMLIAQIGETLVGFVHACVTEAPTLPILVPRRLAVVEGIGVKLGFQKNGIGRMLMEAVQAWAMAKGATAIELNVYEFNRVAMTFYEMLGYQTLSRKMSKVLSREKAG